MMLKRLIVGVLGGASALVYAGDMGSMVEAAHGFRPVIAILGGAAWFHVNTSESFVNTNQDVFTYNSTGNPKTNGFVGGFLGVEHDLWRPGVFAQVGVEYDHYSAMTLNGINTVGIQPDTSTLYAYDYRFKTQQVLGLLKLFATFQERFHPYISGGIGAAFNHAGQYAAVTEETGGINLTPSFLNHNQTTFSYTLGLGIDTSLNQHLRLGLGYRYAGFGTITLGAGTVVFGDYSAPVSFSPSARNVGANQFVAQLSYVV